MRLNLLLKIIKYSIMDLEDTYIGGIFYVS